MGANSPEYIHTAIQTQRLAYADRGKYMADPDFVKVPLAGLSDKGYAAEQRGKINPVKDSGPVSAGDPGKYESGSTTSFSVIDKDGNMITVTQTINYWFGAGVVPDGTGILLNDEMDDFVPKAGKRPLSSMAPTLVLKGDKPVMAVGSPGGPLIITAVSEIIVNVIDFKMDMQSAIETARFHNQNGGQTMIESSVPETVRQALIARGHDLSL